MCSTHTATFPDNNGLSNNLHDNPVLPGFSTSPGWVLVTRGGWCRFRGCCRSRPTHPSSRFRIYAQERHGKDIHSHIHSHTPVHTPRKRKRKRKSKTLNWPIWCLRLLVLFLSTVVLGDGQEARHLLLRTVPRRTPSRLGSSDRKHW